MKLLKNYKHVNSKGLKMQYFGKLMVLSALVLVTACGKSEEKVDIEGDRISILSYDRELLVDPRLEETEIQIPPAFNNSSWTQPGGFPSNALYHLALGEVEELFSVGIVEGNSAQTRIMASPLVAEGRVFVMGAELDIVAVDASTGKEIWEQDVVPEWTKRNTSLTRFLGFKEKKLSPDDGFMGGMAYEAGHIFVATGFGELVCINAGTGEITWRVRSDVPFSNAPTVRDGKIYIVAQDSRLQVFATADGKRIWDYLAITETAGILSSSSPAVSDQVVVAGFNSGEVVSLRTLNGTENWSDSLSARSMQVTPISELTAIVGRPVIDRDRVFAVSHGGRMVSIDVRSGERAWTADVGSIETPWVTLDSVFVVTTDSKVVALTRNLGRIRWISQLPAFEDEEDRDGRISWAGPVLAGGQLIVASSEGEIYFMSPNNGDIMRRIDVGDPISVPPIVANETLYILTDEGELLAYR